MSKIIDAIYENGVFKPLENVEVKEHEKVSIKIISLEDWQTRFNKIIDKIRRNYEQYSPDEIEADIADAVKEVRDKKYGR